MNVETSTLLFIQYITVQETTIQHANHDGQSGIMVFAL